MIIGSEVPLDKVEAGSVPVAPPDPRLEAFRLLLQAVDNASWPDGQRATRLLRHLGFSVVLVKPSADRGAAS